MSAKLNGKPLEQPCVTNDEIARVSVLELEMSILPNKNREAISQMTARRK